MKYFCFTFLITLSFDTSKDSVDYNNQEKEVLAVIKIWNDAFAKNDLEKYFSYIHDSLTLFVPSSPYRIDGKIDDKEEFTYSLDKGWTRVGYFHELQPKVRIYGNTAIVTYHSRGTYGTDDSEKEGYLKETDILIKENNQWKIMHIHVSSIL